MLLRALLIVLTLALPARAEEGPNLMPSAQGQPGPVARYVAAADLLGRGVAAEDAITVLTAVRMARAVRLRAATGWGADPSELPAPPEARGLPGDPGGAEALLLLEMMVAGEVELRFLAEEQLARPSGTGGAASQVSAGLAPGARHSWRLPLYGATPAEIGLIAVSGQGLTLRVTDAAGHEICATTEAGLCAFTPARNGWFTVELANGGTAPAGYLLMTN